MTQKVEASNRKAELAEEQVSILNKQNLSLKQMNFFSQKSENQKDNDLYDGNFKLREEVKHKDNIISSLQDEIVNLKRTI